MSFMIYLHIEGYSCFPEENYVSGKPFDDLAVAIFQVVNRIVTNSYSESESKSKWTMTDDFCKTVSKESQKHEKTYSWGIQVVDDLLYPVTQSIHELCQLMISSASSTSSTSSTSPNIMGNIISSSLAARAYIDANIC